MSSSQPPEAPDMSTAWTCYKHSDRPCGVRCSRCEKPICPDCMISAPVGFQCRACVKGAPPVMSIHNLTRKRPVVTTAIIIAAVAAFLPSLTGGSGSLNEGGSLGEYLELFGPLVADGEWWRLFTSGFVHYGLMHLGFNMAILYYLGSQIEPELGSLRFGLLYLTGLVGGALGALVIDPVALTGGASGAVFGLIPPALILLQRRGENLRASGLPALLVVNLITTFVIPGISIGGHLGGLLFGGIAGVILVDGANLTPSIRSASGSSPTDILRTVSVGALIAVVTFAGVYVAANPL